MSKFILSNNTDVLGIFDTLNVVSSVMLDNIINYLNIFVEFKKLNNNINLPNYTFKIDEIKECIVKENIITYNLINDEIDLLYSLNSSENKITIIANLLSNLLDENVFENIFNKRSSYNIFEGTSSDISDEQSNLDNYESSDTSEHRVELVMDEEERDDEKNNIIEEQRLKIEELLRKKRIIESKKNKKKEKDEEITRRFEVDYDVYNKLKNKYSVDTVPDIFKYKYVVFKEMENNNFLDDKIKAKQYYIKNFNVINKNIGSSIFNNIFSQKEPEEDLVEVEESDNKFDNIKELSDSDESINNENIQSEDILLH